jgi:uncharacterized beta-barrel protein YwiB (DUF1934 family)
MKIKSTILALIVLFMVSCSKDTVEPIIEPEPDPVADASVAAAFYENTPYFEIFIYRFDAETAKWTNRIRSHFPAISEQDPNYLGFRQIYVDNSGVNLFQMVTLYKNHLGTTNLKTVGINVDKVLTFFPTESADGLKTNKGIVKVFGQKVKMYTKGDIKNRENMEFVEIGISGEGTYDLETGVIDLDVHFDETSIGGPAKVTRKYKMSKTALEL